MLKSLRVLFDEFHQGQVSFDSFLHEPVLATSVYFEGRRVYIASDSLKRHQAFLNQSVVPFLRCNENVVFSYRSGAKPSDAIVPHLKSKYFFRADLMDYFESIDRDFVRDVFVRDLDHLPFEEPLSFIERLADLLTFDDHLPRGFSTSSPLSNSCLYALDNRLQGFAADNNLIFTRYSDDLILSGNSSETVKAGARALERFIAELYGNTFVLNAKKSRFMSPGQRVQLLGMTVLPNATMTINKAIKNRVETLLHFYSTDAFKFLEFAGEQDAKRAERRLGGYISFINSADQVYLSKLKRKFSDSLVEKFLRLPIS